MSAKLQPMYMTYGVKDETGAVHHIEVPISHQKQTVIRDYYVGSKPRLAKANARQSGVANTLINNGMEEADRDWFRPESAIPVIPSHVFAACGQAYDRFSIVKNIIDMMADFTAKGIDVENKTQAAQDFGREWFARVNGYDRTERIAHMLYLMGTVPIARDIGKLPKIERTPGQKPLRLKRPSPIAKGHIPLNYTILNPMTIDLPDTMDTSSVPSVSSYGVRITNEITNRGNDALLNGPSWFSDLNKEDDFTTVALDPAKHVLLFYKKADHDVVPRPLMYPILRDLRNLGKLKMSDDAALDGACSRTRLWRLGYFNADKPENSFMPSPEALSHLAETLAQNVGGGTMDLVWDPLLDFKESSTDLHHFLGKEKYVPTLEAIYQGFGVPPAMSGGGGSAGHTNNFVSISILAERLEYGRNIIRAFWEAELEIIQKEMGFRYPFQITFDEPTFADAAAEKRLLIELMDRGVISDEVVKERFGMMPEVESARVGRETKKRKSGQAPPKASPFSYDWQADVINLRSFVGQGLLTPSQVGLDVPEPKSGELNPLQKRTEEATKLRKASGPAVVKRDIKSVDDLLPPGKNGRPLGKEDLVKRKRKRVVPLGVGALSDDEVSFSHYLIAVAAVEKAQTFINGFVKDVYLQMVKKANIRQLSSAETAELDNVCFAVLCSVSATSKVTADVVREALGRDPFVPEDILAEYEAAVAGLDKDVTVESLRNLKAGLVASHQVTR